MQTETVEEAKQTIEREREMLHKLIDQEASKEAIQHQSELLDKHIAHYYSLCG